MTKKRNNKNTDAAEHLSLRNPCGDYCDVEKGQFCPDCADWADLHGDGVEESAKSSDRAGLRNT